MSHFSVLIVADSTNEVEHLLDPYYANHERGSEYVQFEDKTEYWLRQYNSSSPKTEKRSFKELYPTFENFMAKYHGLDKEDRHEGRYGYWQNPNAKWDWWVTGGRWADFLKDKNGNYVTHARVKDLDFDTDRQKAAEEAGHLYDLMMEAIDGEKFETWSECMQRFEHQKARQFYLTQPAVKRIKDFLNVQNAIKPIDIDIDYDRFITQSREEYVKENSLTVVTPFAWLDEDGWLERGEMLQFGKSINEMSPIKWGELIQTNIDSLHPEQWLWAIDCHI